MRAGAQQRVPFGHESRQGFVAESFICRSSARKKEESSVPVGSVVAQYTLCCLPDSPSVALFVPSVSLWHWLSLQTILSFLVQDQDSTDGACFPPSVPHQFLLCGHFPSLLTLSCSLLAHLFLLLCPFLPMTALNIDAPPSNESRPERKENKTKRKGLWQPLGVKIRENRQVTCQIAWEIMRVRGRGWQMWWPWRRDCLLIPRGN